MHWKYFATTYICSVCIVFEPNILFNSFFGFKCLCSIDNIPFLSTVLKELSLVRVGLGTESPRIAFTSRTERSISSTSSLLFLWFECDVFFLFFFFFRLVDSLVSEWFVLALLYSWSLSSSSSLTSDSDCDCWLSWKIKISCYGDLIVKRAALCRPNYLTKS